MKKTAVILLFLGLDSSVFALESVKNNADYVTYSIKQGENFSFLASKYLEGKDALAQLLKLNHADKPNAIPVGKDILFPRELVKYRLSTATVSNLSCNNAILVNDSTKTLEIGSVINEDDILKVPASCQIGVTLEEGTNINLVSGTILKIKTLRKSELEKSPKVDFELMNGRVDVEVVKRPKGDAAFEIHTPKALAGVRGTKFRVGYDEQKNTSQVEVKTGVVAAKGQASNDAGAALTENQGMPISEDGVAGAVETLPLSPNFLAVEKQTNASEFKVKFQADQNADRHILRRSPDATFSKITDDHLVNIPQIELNQLSTNAVFYQWIALTKSGLQGSSSEYAICKSEASELADRCNVSFNMHGFQQITMRVQKLDTAANSYQDIVKTGLNIAERDQFILKNLPAGKYQWQINYMVGSDSKVERKGGFDLIVVN